MLVSSEAATLGKDLRLQTRINVELRQDSNTSNLIFDVGSIVAFFSQGTNLQKICMIMTGTPPGAGLGYKPPRWLKHGDMVEVSIERFDATRDKIIFA